MVLPMFSFDSQAISFVSEELKQLEKEQLPFATSYAINTVARKVRDAEKEEIKRVFDEPTRWTVNSIFINPSSKNDLEAVVWLKDWAPKGTPAADYLQPHIQGGPRQLKRYEKALKRKGMLKAGEYTVPANTFKKNRYGNISQGQYTKMLSNVGAQNDIWQNSRDSKKIQYFVRPQHFQQQDRHNEALLRRVIQSLPHAAFGFTELPLRVVCRKRRQEPRPNPGRKSGKRPSKRKK